MIRLLTTPKRCSCFRKPPSKKISSGMNKPYRLAYLVSHPIQYQAPLLRYIASRKEIDLTVFFLSDFSSRKYQDPGFGARIRWDPPILEGYNYVVACVRQIRQNFLLGSPYVWSFSPLKKRKLLDYIDSRL